MTLIIEIVNFPFLDGYVPCTPSYSVYISLLIRLASVCSNINYFNKRNAFWLLKYLKVIGIITVIKHF